MVIALLRESLQTDDAVSLNASLAPSEWEFYEALWQERAWMVRRVDRVSVIDRNRVQLSISFTISNDAIVQTLRDAGLFCAHDEQDSLSALQIALPLFQWERKPILDVDVRDSSGQRLAVATGNTNIRIAESILLHKAYSSGSPIGRSNVDPLFERLSSDLFYVLRTGSYRRYEILASQAEGILKEGADGILTEAQETELDYFHYWNDFLQFTDLDVLATLMQSHIFIVYVNVDPRVNQQVISCRLVVDNKFELGKPEFGRATYRHEIRATGFHSQDRRVHVRLESPHGMRIAFLELTKIHDQTPVASEQMRSNITPEFVELIRRSDGGNDEVGMRITLHYMPKRSTFVAPSTFLSMSYCAVILVSSLVPNPGDISVAILTAVPAIAAASLTKDINHDLASHVCERSRWAFAYISIAVLLSSMLMASLQETRYAWVAWTLQCFTFVASAVFLASSSKSLWTMRRYIKLGCHIR